MPKKSFTIVKKIIIYLVLIGVLQGCSKGVSDPETPFNVGSLSEEAQVLVQFLEVYPKISRALTLNSTCEILPSPVSSRFEGYVSALNVRLTQNAEIPKTVVQRYQTRWQESAQKQPERAADCGDTALAAVNSAMTQAQTLYRKIH